MKDREIDEKRPEDVREVGEIEKGTVMENHKGKGGKKERGRKDWCNGSFHFCPFVYFAIFGMSSYRTVISWVLTSRSTSIMMCREVRTSDREPMELCIRSPPKTVNIVWWSKK